MLFPKQQAISRVFAHNNYIIRDELMRSMCMCVRILFSRVVLHYSVIGYITELYSVFSRIIITVILTEVSRKHIFVRTAVMTIQYLLLKIELSTLLQEMLVEDQTEGGKAYGAMVILGISVELMRFISFSIIYHFKGEI